MAERGATGAADLARDAGLNERYVREWLAVVVTGGIVEDDIANVYIIARP